MWNALNRPWKFYLRPTHFWRLKSSPTWVGGTEGSVTWLSQTHLQSSQVFVPPFGTCGQMHVMSISCMTGPSTWNRYFLPLVPLFVWKDCTIADWHWCFLLHSYIVLMSTLWVHSFQDAIKSTPLMAPEYTQIYLNYLYIETYHLITHKAVQIFAKYLFWILS